MNISKIERVNRKTQFFTVVFHRKTHLVSKMYYLCTNKKAVKCYTGHRNTQELVDIDR